MDFIYYIASSTPLLWINTIEYDRAIKTLANKSYSLLNMTCYKWDVVTGTNQIEFEEKNNKQINIDNDEITPIQPIQFLCDLKTSHNIIFCSDFHLFLNTNDSVDLWRTLLNNLDKLKKNNNIFVIISPFFKIINEISRYFTIIDFNLPNKLELINILQNTIKENNINLNKNENKKVINAGLGLTEYEFENALAQSISQYGTIESNIIYEIKKNLIKQNQSLSICNSTNNFSNIIGLDNLKSFTKKMVLSKQGKGVLLLGIPGTGKSEFAKCLGCETNRLTISLNFGNLMSSLVGETELKTKNALNLIDNLSPCILFIDEIEKGLSGMSGDNNDAGVSKRQGGTFLSWLNDHKSDVYVIATANNISAIPNELLRAERWDCTFFIDFPCKSERDKLLEYYKNQYHIQEDIYSNLLGYTGAEIKTLCRLASSLNISLKEAQKYICPINKIANKKMQKLREWAKNRTVNASDYSQELFQENDVNRMFVNDDGLVIPRKEM